MFKLFIAVVCLDLTFFQVLTLNLLFQQPFLYYHLNCAILHICCMVLPHPAQVNTVPLLRPVPISNEESEARREVEQFVEAAEMELRQLKNVNTRVMFTHVPLQYMGARNLASAIITRLQPNYYLAGHVHRCASVCVCVCLYMYVHVFACVGGCPCLATRHHWVVSF